MPYYVYVPDTNGSYIQRGPYLSGSKADRVKEKMEEETHKEAEVKSWPTWDPSRAKKNFKEELVDRVGVSKGMRNFSSGKHLSK